MEQTLRQLSEKYLGTQIEPVEWEDAKTCAEYKLKTIIEREGDADGKRREQWYLARIIAETVRSNRFAGLSKLMNCVNAQFGVKKNSPHPKM